MSSIIRRYIAQAQSQVGEYALLLANGLLLGCAAPGIGLWPLAWVGLIPAFLWVRRQTRLLKVLSGGFWLGFGFHGLYMAWFFGLHPLAWLGFNPAQSWLVATLAWLIVTVTGGLLTAAILGLYGLISRLPVRLSLPVMLVYPIVWVGCFGVLQVFPMGIPWALLEYTQAEVSWMRWLAGLAGGSAITVLLLWHNLLWAELCRRYQVGWMALLAFVVPGLLWLTAGYSAPAGPKTLPLPVAVLQGNLPIDLIRSSSLTPEVMKRVYLSTLEQTTFPVDTLVVLPEEGAIPGQIDARYPTANPAFQAFADLARRKRIYIAAGTIVEAPNTLTPAPDDWNTYNALVLISPYHDGVMSYEKRKLVPFGEYTPFLDPQWLSGFLGSLGVDYYTGFEAGTSTELLTFHTRYAPPTQSVSDIRAGGLVCFELIYPALSRQYREQGANLLINSSNLGWFHGHPLLEAQFLAIGQIRAAENHLPLVISSNTGISAILSSTGEILKKSPARQKALITEYHVK